MLLSKALFAIIVCLFVTLTTFKLEQPAKASDLISKTDSGIVISHKDVQSKNADSPITVTLPNFTSFSLLHPMKLQQPICPAGTFTFTKAVSDENAKSPICFNESDNITYQRELQFANAKSSIYSHLIKLIESMLVILKALSPHLVTLSRKAFCRFLQA